MQLAQNYRTDGKTIGDLMVQGFHHEAGAYSTYGRVSTGENNYDRKRKGVSDNNDNDDTGHYGNKICDKYNRKNTKRTMVVDM